MKFWASIRSNELLRSGIIRGGSALLAIRTFGIALTFASQIVVAQLLSTEGYGAYAYLFAALSLFVIPAKLGSDIASVRFVSEYRAARTPAVLGPYLQFTMRVVVMASIVAAAAWLLVMRLGFLRPEGIGFTAQLLAVAPLPLFALTRFAEGALRGDERLAVAFVPYAVGLPALLILVSVGIAVLRQGPVGVVNVLGAQLTAFVAIASFQLMHVRRLGYRSSVATVGERQRRTWLRAMFSLGVLSAFGVVLGQVDVVMVGALLGNREAGQYAAAWRVASLIGGFLIVFNLVIAPSVARLWVERDVRSIQRIVDLGVGAVTMASLPLMVGVILFREPILRLFGGGFTEASDILVVLSVAQLANAAGGPVGVLLNMTGHERQAATVLGLTALFNLVMNIVLIQLMGMIGAAIGTAVCTMIWNVGLALVVYRRLRILPLLRFVLHWSG